jgi:SAM-dependent methyltransferase
MDPDHVADARRMAHQGYAKEDAYGWFEQLYAAADEGTAGVPWDRPQAQPLLAAWAGEAVPDGAGKRALVVGCGYGRDAELIAALGYAVTAFDVAPSAVAAARRRFPGSPVEFVTADLMDLPPAWSGAFDLAYESLTVQSLPVELHERAIAAVASTVAPGGTLLVVASAHHGAEPFAGPPWPLSRDEVVSFGAGGLEPVAIDDIRDAEGPTSGMWRAEFRRPVSPEAG